MVTASTIAAARRGHHASAVNVGRVGPVPALTIRSKRRVSAVTPRGSADGIDDRRAQLGSRRDIGQQLGLVRKAGLLAPDLGLDRLALGEGGLELFEFIVLEQAARIEESHLEELLGVRDTDSSTPLHSRSRTSALERADFTVPIGVSSSSPICLRVCPPVRTHDHRPLEFRESGNLVHERRESLFGFEARPVDRFGDRWVEFLVIFTGLIRDWLRRRRSTVAAG